MYRYVKLERRIPYALAAISLLSVHRNKALMALSFIFIISGTLLIANALLPIFLYEVTIASSINNSTPPKILTHIISNTQHPVSAAPSDLTDAANWFDSKPAPSVVSTSSQNIEFYNLSIPKLGVQNAVVTVGGTDLNQSLIQYRGTADPGKPGNPVIFGHSVLPQFFNPKNYVSIFSTLPTLENGDRIVVDYDGIRYLYQVFEKKEVKPTELSVLEQRYDRREISLITCVPPGTYLRRLVVKAKLIEN